MTQATMIMGDGDGFEVLNEMSAALKALASQNSGPAAPTETYAGMFWLDTSTTPPTIRMLGSDGATWHPIGVQDSDNLGLVSQANLQAGKFDYAADTGAANAYSISPTPAVAAYVAGLWLTFKATAANTGGSTLNVSGLGAKALNRRDGNPLQQGDIVAGSICEVIYDGTNFQLLSAIINSANPPTTQVRQTVLNGIKNSSGAAAFIAAATGAAANAQATLKPLVMAFANGFGSTGPSDLISQISADQANFWNNLPVNNPAVFLAIDRDPTTGALSGSNTLVPPQYGTVFDPTKAALLHFDGANTAATFLDDYGNTWTQGGSAKLSNVAAKFGATSLLLNGSTDYVQNTTITALPDKWTLECDVNFSAWPASGAYCNPFSLLNNSGFGAAFIIGNSSGTISAYMNLSSNGTGNDIGSIHGGFTGYALNTWYHFAISFDGSAYRLFVNGNLDAIVYSTARICPVSKNLIGSSWSGTALISFVNGYIDEFRLSPCARYVQNFTPPAAAFAVDGHFYDITEGAMYAVSSASTQAGVNPGMTKVLRLYAGETPTNAASALMHFDSDLSDAYGNTWGKTGNPTISTAQSKFGGASVLLNGTSDSLIQSNIGKAWNTSAWCVEGFFNLAALPASGGINQFFGSYGMHLRLVNTSGTNKLGIFLSSTGNNSWDIANNVSGSSTNWAAGTWYHLAMTYDGATYRVFINGVLDWSLASSTRIAQFTQFWLGNDGGSLYMNGYVDEFRISQQARYTAAFTPPSSPFAIDESKLVSPISYAYQGKQVVVSGALALSQYQILNHAIGTVPRNVRAVLRNLVGESGYQQGDETPMYAFVDGTTHRKVMAMADRKNVYVDVHSGGPTAMNKNGAYGDYAITPANWAVALYLDRGF